MGPSFLTWLEFYRMARRDVAQLVEAIYESYNSYNNGRSDETPDSSDRRTTPEPGQTCTIDREDRK